VSVLGRMVALGRWLCAGETLGSGPPESPSCDRPGPGLLPFFLREDHLPSPADAPPADPAAAARPSFWRWLLTPEPLPRADGARHPGAES